MKHSILVYGNSQTCAHCRQLKQWLADNQIEHTYKDLGSDDHAKRIEHKKEAHALGLKSIPSIFIDDMDVIVGFDEKKLAEILL